MTTSGRVVAYLVTAAMLASGLPLALHAQERPEPRLIFSIFGGVVNAGGLWDIPQQPFLLVFGPAQWDTIRLRRRMTTAPIAGLNATIYRSSHVGITGEAAYLGLRLDDDCTMLFENTDVQQRNAQVCNDVTRRTRTVSNVGFSLGAAYRFVSRSAVTPYVRAQGGVSVRSSSLIAVAGRYNEALPNGSVVVRERAVIDEESRTSVTPMAALAAGVMLAITPVYHFRAEIRDHFLILKRLTGPADDQARVTTESFLSHAPALVFGFDIVLERRRGRRY